MFYVHMSLATNRKQLVIM